MQLLQVVAHTNWGADWKTLLKFMQGKNLMKLDYRNFVYQSSRRPFLKILNSTYEGLRLGGSQTSLAEANEILLNLTSQKLSLQYYINLKSCPITLHTIAYLRGAYDKFPDFFVWALLLRVHTWNSSPLWSNLLRLHLLYRSNNLWRPHGSPLVWACQWPSSQSLSSPQLSHNDSLWA